MNKLIRAGLLIAIAATAGTVGTTATAAITHNTSAHNIGSFHISASASYLGQGATPDDGFSWG